MAERYQAIGQRGLANGCHSVTKCANSRHPCAMQLDPVFKVLPDGLAGRHRHMGVCTRPRVFLLKSAMSGEPKESPVENVEEMWKSTIYSRAFIALMLQTRLQFPLGRWTASSPSSQAESSAKRVNHAPASHHGDQCNGPGKHRRSHSTGASRHLEIHCSIPRAKLTYCPALASRVWPPCVSPWRGFRLDLCFCRRIG